MTLMELSVALAIMSLAILAVVSNIGPWIKRSQALAAQSLAQTDAAAAQLVLSELAAGVVDPSTASANANEFDANVLLPRLSPAPFRLTLAVETEAAGSRLIATAPEAALPPTVLLALDQPMRLSYARPLLSLETRERGVWIPLASSMVAANTAMHCVYDPIPRSCRS